MSRLLPDATTLRLDECDVDTPAAQITLRVRSTQTTALCPLCTTPAHRIHSHYERTLADLPWAAYQVRLQLHVRKWFCRNRACRRRIFTERLPTVAAPGRDARCGWLSASGPLAWRWVVQPVCTSAASGICW